MRTVLFVALCAMPVGCTSLPNAAPAAPQYTTESCLDRAVASGLYTRTKKERTERSMANAQRKVQLGFSEDNEMLAETHSRPIPIRPPIPTFPSCASQNGLNGYCNVIFDVDVSGTPINIDPNCSHPVFDREAARAVSQAEFRPATIDGEPVEYPGIIYPISLTLEY